MSAACYCKKRKKKQQQQGIGLAENAPQQQHL
jgi:hypothetical protein